MRDIKKISMSTLVERMNNHFDSKFRNHNSNNTNSFNSNVNFYSNNNIYYNCNTSNSNIINPNSNIINSNSNLICKDTSYMLGRNEGYITIHYNNIPIDFMRNHCS
jgi:hypothetical protein